jgi:hypothetical protein
MVCEPLFCTLLHWLLRARKHYDLECRMLARVEKMYLECAKILRLRSSGQPPDRHQAMHFLGTVHSSLF